MDVLDALAPFAIRGMFVFLRVTGVFLFFPVFGGNSLPALVKALFALSLTLVLVPVVPAPVGPLPSGLLAWTMAGGREFLTGAIMSTGMLFLFAAVQFAGQLIDFEMGFGVVNAIDPSTSLQVPIMGLFHFILGILLFIVTNAHHLVIRALADSFSVVPLGAATFDPGLVHYYIGAFGVLFVQGVKLAAPVLVTLLLYTAAIGIVAKTVPTINLLIVGFPIRIGLGLLTVGAALPVFGPLFQQGIAQMIADMRTLAHLMG